MESKIKKMNFNLNIFSLYRSELMGIATLLVIFVHMIPYGVDLPYIMKVIIGNGGLGVDIFLFLSGMGIYNSYKNKNQSFLCWLYKRYIRIILPLCLISIPIMIGEYIFSKRTLYSILLEINGFGPLFGYGRLWYIPCILSLYCISPFLFYVLNKSPNKYVTLFFLCFGILFICYYYDSSAIWVFALKRYPSFIIGFFIAENIKQSQQVSIITFVFIPLLFYVIFYLLNHKYDMHFSLFWLQGIPIMTIFAIILQHLHWGIINRFLCFMGIISLESYITNDYVLRAIKPLFIEYCNSFNKGNYFYYFWGSIVCIIISYFSNKAYNYIRK